MAFSKSYPKGARTTAPPQWEEVYLSEDEERKAEEDARQENIALLYRCIEDAKKVLEKSRLRPYQTNLVDLAIALFEKQASHAVYWKERRAKEKFDQLYNR